MLIDKGVEKDDAVEVSVTILVNIFFTDSLFWHYYPKRNETVTPSPEIVGIMDRILIMVLKLLSQLC